MKKWLIIATKVFIGLIIILAIAWTILFVYFRQHKKELLQKTIAAIEKNINGSVTVSDLDLSFPSTFPYISAELENVVLRDSLFSVHHHNLLDAKLVYLQINPFTALFGGFSISRVVVEDGNLYAFEDAGGYSNLSAVNRPKKNEKEKKQVNISGLRLINMHLVYDRHFKNKMYDFNVKNFNCSIRREADNDHYKIKMNMIVNTLSFNTEKGSFAKNQPLSGNIALQFNKPSNTLNFENLMLSIGGETFGFSGKFNFSGERNFHLDVNAPKADFAKTVTLLPYSISRNLDSIYFDKNLYAKAIVDGRLINGYKAAVRIDWKVKNAAITTSFGKLTNTSFTGFFLNHMSDTMIASPENSMIQIVQFKGEWEGVALQSNKLAISNLKKPVMHCDLKADADLVTLNQVAPTATFQFNKGTFSTNLVYAGPIYDSATEAPSINGIASVKNASLVYGPRQIQLDELNGDIDFSGSDVYFKNITALAQGNKIEMNVTAINLLTLMNQDPSRAILKATIHSPEIDISKFTSFIGDRKQLAPAKTVGMPAGKKFSQIDKLLDQCSIVSAISADKIKFRKFIATDVRSNIALTNQVWAIQNTSFKHAGGMVTLDGELRGGSRTYNPIKLNAVLSSIDVASLFNTFNNFNLSSLHANNLRGKLNSNISISGALLDKAELVPSSLKGTVSLSLQDGELNNFEPLESMSLFIFKNRNFSHINFSELHNRFDFDGSTVYINRMEIQSNVLQLFMEGLYDMNGKSTNLQIQVPLSNLKKRDPDYVPDKKGVEGKKGISVFVNAKSNNNGGIDFSYSLFHKKAGKK